VRRLASIASHPPSTPLTPTSTTRSTRTCARPTCWCRSWSPE
jgi:hypothetical protein